MQRAAATTGRTARVDLLAGARCGFGSGRLAERRRERSVALQARVAGLFQALALVVIEEALAQAQRDRGDLDQLVGVDELERRLQRKGARGGEEQLLVGGGGADVGQLLGLRRVDDQIVVARVQPDDLAPVYLDPRSEKELPALLQIEEPVGVGLAVVLRDEHAVRSSGSPRRTG